MTTFSYTKLFFLIKGEQAYINWIFSDLKHDQPIRDREFEVGIAL